MKVTVFFLVFVAMILYAIHRGRDIRLSLRLLGADASLEVTGSAHTEDERER